MDAERHAVPQGDFSTAHLPPPPSPHPSKEQVRAYMERRKRTRQPPPAPAEIRRQLGWTRPAALSMPVMPGLLPAVLSATLAELAAVTLLAWYVALVPGRHVLSKKNDQAIS